MHNEKITESIPCAEEQVKAIYSQLAWLGDAISNLKERLESVTIPDDAPSEPAKLDAHSMMPALNDSLNTILLSVTDKARIIESIKARLTL